MRDYTRIDHYLNEIAQEVYPQPEDAGHTGWAIESINAFLPNIHYARTILDVGCGEAFCQPIFEERGFAYVGVCLGEDHHAALTKGRNVLEADFNFLDFADGSFDLIYSRHSLEHSFSPLLTLKEWHRITRKYLALVLPSPVFWEYRGQNHYYVLNDPQWRNLFEHTNFEVTFFHSKTQNMTTDPNIPPVEIEYWYLLEKK